MTDVAGFLADAAPKVRRDGFGRYLLPHPGTGKEMAFTRATTAARTIANTFGLERWKQRKAARGLSRRFDLVARIASEYEDDQTVDLCVAKAMEHAGSTVAATLGTAMHRFTEQLDAGEEMGVVPPPLDADLAAYQKAITAHGLVIQHIERITCCPDLATPVAGTLDRIVTTPAGDLIVADLKTGADMEDGFTEMVIQQAVYNHGAGLFNLDTQAWEPMPPVRQDVAYIIHLPIGQATCTIWEIDTAAGWDALTNLCLPVRDWRNRRDLGHILPAPAASPVPPVSAASPVTPGPSIATVRPGGSGVPVPGDGPPAGPGGNGDRATWITGRLRALAGDEHARAMIAQAWPEGVTVKPPWPDAGIDSLARLLDQVEAAMGADFGASDPATPPPRQLTEPGPSAPPPVPPWPEDDGVAASDDEVKVLAAALTFLNDQQLARLRNWSREAVRERRAFDTKPMTRRVWACCRAAIALAGHTENDTAVRAGIANIVGRWEEAWAIGAVIGSLSLADAEAVTDWADASNDPF